MSIHPTAKIHTTSIIDQSVEIGEETNIWHWVHVSQNATIGNYCSLGQNVFVGKNVRIGNNVKIQNNVSIYENVFLEDNVFCGPSMVFTNVINPRAEIPRKKEYRSTHICKGVTLGANCTIVCGVKIGDYAFIGAGSVVTQEINPFALIVGVPGKQIGWMSKYGEKIDLPIYGTGEWQCPHLGDCYQLKGEHLYLK